MHHGYSWMYALTGALMPVVYTIANHASIGTHTNDHDWDNFALLGGTAWAESVWGCWLWLVIICLCFTRRRWGALKSDISGGGGGGGFGGCEGDHSVRVGNEDALPSSATSSMYFYASGQAQPYRSNFYCKNPVFIKWFEIFVAVFQLVNIASVGYYATIKQCDHDNWLQSFVSLVVTTGLLLYLQIRFYITRYRLAHSGEYEPLLGNTSTNDPMLFQQSDRSFYSRVQQSNNNISVSQHSQRSGSVEYDLPFEASGIYGVPVSVDVSP